MPKPNEGKTDRTVRIVLGVILLGLALFSLSGIAQTVAVVAGVISLVTGAIGFCGLYKILGISTMEKK
jgi:thiol:disulfide interchange protein